MPQTDETRPTIEIVREPPSKPWIVSDLGTYFFL